MSLNEETRRIKLREAKLHQIEKGGRVLAVNSIGYKTILKRLLDLSFSGRYYEQKKINEEVFMRVKVWPEEECSEEEQENVEAGKDLLH